MIKETREIVSRVFGIEFTYHSLEQERYQRYCRLGFRSVITTPHRSNTVRSLFRSISRSVVPEMVPVGMIASFTESWMTKDFAPHKHLISSTWKELTSIFENKSLSTNSVMPSSRTLVSAKATPSVFVLALVPELIVVAGLMDITTGDESKLESTKSKSSTA